MTDQTENTVPENTEDQVPEIEQELDVYPLRDPSEDPRWALWVMWIWIGISLGLFLFFVVLFILGIWYD